jgi:hypothetical protein
MSLAEDDLTGNKQLVWIEVDGDRIRTIREYLDSHYVASLGPVLR